MGYACPVCGVEQADGVHLANHLAVTASLGREDHREWIEAHAPDWGECTPAELAERVVEHAPEVETPGFEDGESHGPDLESELAARARRPGRGGPVADADDVLAEARELTRRMYGEGESGDVPDEDENG